MQDSSTIYRKYCNVGKKYQMKHCARADKVWVHFKVTGTHKGEWAIFGITLAPAGKKITYTGVGIWRIVDGKVVERKSVRDMLDLLKQLGVIEYTEKAKKLFPEDAK